MPTRTILPLFAALLLSVCLWGCAEAGPTEQGRALDKLTGSFTSTISIRYGELTAEASIVRDSPRSCTVTFTAPASLEDMAFVFREDCVDVTYKGLQLTFDPSSMPGRAVAKTAVSALNAPANGGDLLFSETNGVLEVNGQTESGAFLLQVDPGSGKPLKLLVPDEDLEIEFLNFVFLK